MSIMSIVMVAAGGQYNGVSSVPSNGVAGTQVGGGYLAGYIMVSSVKYALIVAPKATGENVNKMQQKTANSATTGTQSVNDGWTNTNAMNNSSHPAAQWTRSLNIGGFTDWYLPAKDELEICYRSFKPTTQNNYLSTSYIPQGNGYNANSSPVGAAYSSSVPGQTSVTAFIHNGTEAFRADDDYWTSTEYGPNSTYSWIQNFSNGNEHYDDKTNTSWVRAVRRVAV
jgi:hypothetical protein